MKSALTFRPRFQDPDAPKQVEMFHDWSEREYLGVPRAWGLKTFRGRVPLLDKTTRGSHEVSVPRLPDFHHPRVLNPAQQEAFHDELVSQFQRSRGFIGSAGTGTGKTVVSLRVAGGTIKRPTLILLHLERLMWQWHEEIADKLGVSPERIGVVQSDRCEYEGKDFVVGMLHSVAQREYPKSFYRHFGLVIYDEVHKIGSQFFAPVAYRFPSHNWLGLSATVERSDGGERIFYNHLGGIAVKSEAAALPMDVFPRRYVSRKALWGKSRMTRLKCLAGDHDRNLWLAGHIKDMWQAGRTFLAVSEYVDHIQSMMDLCVSLGIPKEDMGQFTGQTHGDPYCPVTTGGQTADGYKFTHVTQRRGSWLPVWSPERDQNNRVVVARKKKDISSDELNRVKKTARITFATYGMITEGIDEPRWDAGIDLLPKAKATQLIGRVRRPLPGKKRPFWLTPYDEHCAFSRGMFQARCKNYRATGAVIKDMV